MKQKLCPFLIAAACSAALWSQPTGPPKYLPRAQEIELALSAAPEHLRAGAGVYVMEKSGYKQVRASTNGFTCLVHRDGPLNSKPTCWDKEGTETIIPAVLREGELLMQGKTVPEVQAELKRDFASGKFIPPRRPGVAYMLGENRNYNPGTKQVYTFPPHVMFYAPNLTNEDIGSNGDGRSGLPFIGYQGPHGYMIVVPEQLAKQAHKDAAGSPSHGAH